MIDHVGYAVMDFEKSKAFYVTVLATLGYKLMMEVTREMTGGQAHAGFGATKPDFWIGEGKAKVSGVHVAFQAKDRDAVKAFHAAALAAGGTDNGKPGLRPHYHENYYGAFVFDPDGNNIEAVCHLLS
jgi:catechol 2,3-dioxygenase-like lactoylglutathione lyase family enzyme